jgi:hypothetical protein
MFYLRCASLRGVALRISLRIRNHMQKCFNPLISDRSGIDGWKNRNSKISWDCPFKAIYWLKNYKYLFECTLKDPYPKLVKYLARLKRPNTIWWPQILAKLKPANADSWKATSPPQTSNADSLSLVQQTQRSVVLPRRPDRLKRPQNVVVKSVTGKIEATSNWSSRSGVPTRRLPVRSPTPNV